MTHYTCLTPLPTHCLSYLHLSIVRTPRAVLMGWRFQPRFDDIGLGKHPQQWCVLLMWNAWTWSHMHTSPMYMSIHLDANRIYSSLLNLSIQLAYWIYIYTYIPNNSETVFLKHFLSNSLQFPNCRSYICIYLCSVSGCDSSPIGSMYGIVYIYLHLP